MPARKNGELAAARTRRILRAAAGLAATVLVAGVPASGAGGAAPGAAEGRLPAPAASPPAFALGPLAAPAAPRPEFAPGEMIVKFRRGLPAGERADALRERDARLKRTLPIRGVVLAGIPTGERLGQVARALERDPRIVWAEPNAYREGMALPNDPMLGDLWGLSNTGQTVAGITGAPDADIDAPEAWDRTTGSADVKVAVIDSGVNLHHPDLASNLWRNPGESGGGRESNGLDDDGNGFVDDWRGWDFIQNDNDPSDHYGHGTHVAGTIAARGDNALGVTGVAWRASIMPVRALDNLNGGYCSELVSAMAYAVRAGAKVVNMSLGRYGACPAERDLIESAPGTLFVLSAGNEGTDVEARPVYPCTYPSPNIVCVAATDSSDQLPDWSNYGATGVDLAAPGVAILSSYVKWGPAETLLTDDFETASAGRWLTGGTPNTWTRTPFVDTRSGAWSLSNSALGYYDNNTDNYARVGIDLTGRRDCAAFVWVRMDLGPFDPTVPNELADRLIAEELLGGATHGSRPQVVRGRNAAFERWIVDLSQFEGRSGGALRFRLVSNAFDTYEGVALDDLEVVCAPPLTNYSGASDEFIHFAGTSMAAPQVSGVAALILSVDPQLSTADLKQRLLSSVDPVPGLAGKTVTGGRLNAARAVGPAPAPTGGPRPAGSKRPRVTTIGRRAELRRGRVTVTLACADAPCAGTVALHSRLGRRPKLLGRGRYSAASGRRVRATIQLGRAARALVARRRKVPATLSVTVAGGSRTVTRLKVERSRRTAAAAAAGAPRYFKVSLTATEDLTWSKDIATADCAVKGEGRSSIRVRTVSAQPAVAERVGGRRIRLSFRRGKPFLPVTGSYSRQGTLEATGVQDARDRCGSAKHTDCGARRYPAGAFVQMKPRSGLLLLRGPYTPRIWNPFRSCPGSDLNGEFGAPATAGPDTGAAALPLGRLFGRAKRFTVEGQTRRTVDLARHASIPGLTGTEPVTTTIQWKMTFVRLRP